MRNMTYVVWLEGIDPACLSAIPTLEKMRAAGGDFHLSPIPLVERRQCYYQLLTGMGPAQLGRYDAVKPENYIAQADVEVPEGSLGHLLLEVIHAHKLPATYIEVDDAQLLGSLSEQELAFALIRLRRAGELTYDQIESFMQQCFEVWGSQANVLVLTDVWTPSPHTLVNVNNFLADVGLLEVTGGTKKDIVWSETLAYGLGTGQIWVNLRGREAAGVVQSGREYHEVCATLMYELQTNWLDHMTGQSIVDQVYKKEDLYVGAYSFKAPDLVAVFKPGYIPSPNACLLKLDEESVLPSGSAEGDVQRGELASPYARLICYGPALREGVCERASLVDVVPNLLYLLDLPIPRSLDGEVLASMFTQAYQYRVPVKYDEGGQLSGEEEGLIVDRLRDLGYLG